MPGRAVLLAVALALAAGCGEGADGERAAEPTREPAPAEAVAAAARTTNEQKTARIAFDATMEISGLAEPVNFAGEGAADFASGESRLTLDMSEFAEVFGTGGGLGDPAGWKGETVYAGDVIYMRLPALRKLLPGAKRWLKIDQGMLMEQGGTQFSAPDPVEFVQFLEAAGREVEDLGEEQVRGVATTRYRATIDVDDLPRAVAPAARAEVEAYARRLRQMGVEEIPLETWVDDDGVARRMRVEYDNMQANGRSANVAFELELFDLGAPVRVDLPPTSQVSDFEALLRGVQK